MTELIKVWTGDKRIPVNNFLKHFFFSLITIGLFVLVQFIQYGTITLDDKLIALLFLIVADLIFAGKKALEQYDKKLAKEFQWIWAYVYKLFKLLIEKIVKR